MKHKQPIKTAHQIQTHQDVYAQIQATQHVTNFRSKLFFIITVLIGIVIATGLYSFEMLPVFSDRYSSALSEFREVELEYKSIQNKINSNISDSQLETEWKTIEERYNNRLDNFKEVRNKERFSQFPSLQYFLGDFGPWLAFSFYTLLFTVISFLYLRRFRGLMLVNSIMIMGCIYYLLWIFQQYQDFAKWKYYGMTFLTAIIVVIAIWRITKHRKNRYEVLAKQKKDLQLLCLKSMKYDDQIDELINLMKKHQEDLKKTV